MSTKKDTKGLVNVTLKVKLSDKELAKKSEELADNITKKQEAEEAKKKEATEHGEKISGLNHEINLLVKTIQNKYTYKDQEAHLEWDYKKKMKVYKDTKSGEVIKEEPFAEGDEQTAIDKEEVGELEVV